jgi:hypothetical protein
MDIYKLDLNNSAPLEFAKHQMGMFVYPQWFPLEHRWKELPHLPRKITGYVNGPNTDPGPEASWNELVVVEAGPVRWTKGPYKTDFKYTQDVKTKDLTCPSWLNKKVVLVPNCFDPPESPDTLQHWIYMRFTVFGGTSNPECLMFPVGWLIWQLNHPGSAYGFPQEWMNLYPSDPKPTSTTFKADCILKFQYHLKNVTQFHWT